MNRYYQNALKYIGTPYKAGEMDCSMLICLATGNGRIWHTGMGKPPPGMKQIKIPNLARFFDCVKIGDVFVWSGHAAFFAGGERLFHAQKPGTVVGYTNDLKLYWIKSRGYPLVYRQA